MACALCVGPFSAVYYIWENKNVPAKAPVPEWILVIGGLGIVAGLSTYGYKIMRVLGVKAVKVTNARGFCLELSTAITVVIASRYGGCSAAASTSWLACLCHTARGSLHAAVPEALNHQA